MVKEVFVIAAKRSAIAKSLRGSLSNYRPDDLLSAIIERTVKESTINPQDIGDCVIGCAFPEGAQGQNVARRSLLLANLPNTIPGITVNRYCSSGLNAIAIAANSIRSGECEVAIAGGVESMTMIPMGGYNFSVSPKTFLHEENIAIGYGMGLTAEIIAKKWQITREAQDQFALRSNSLATAAIKKGYFEQEIIPLEINKRVPNGETISEYKTIFKSDECVRQDTSLEALAKLKPAFANHGTVTAGNSSQMSDAASVLIMVSGEYLLRHKLVALAKFHGFAVTGVAPEIMGMGPVSALPKALAMAGISLSAIDWIELNEAFAAQSLAVIQELHLNPAIVNPSGGAIALGHPLGATGAILATKLIHGLKRTNKRYGVVTMCVGTGMGAAGVFENVL